MIRPARREDLDALIEVGRRAWLSAFAQTAPFALIAWWAKTDRTAALYREAWPQMLVFEEAGRIAGLVQPVAAEINGLWVHPERQGRGIGTELLRAGEGAIARAGHAVAWLTCSALNARALAFYERRGYAEVRRERASHASGVEIEDVRLERDLGARRA